MGKVLRLCLALALPSTQSAQAAQAAQAAVRIVPDALPLAAGAESLRFDAAADSLRVDAAADLVLGAFTMGLTFHGSDFAAPSAAETAREGVPPALTITPRDHALAAAFLGQAKFFSSPEPIILPGRTRGPTALVTGPGVNLLSLHGAVVTVRENPLAPPAEGRLSYQTLFTVVTALRAAAERGTIDREGMLAAAQAIYDGSRRLARTAADPPDAPLVQEVRYPRIFVPAGLLLPDEPAGQPSLMLITTPLPFISPVENATLAGKQGDSILHRLFPHALDNILQTSGVLDGGFDSLKDRARHIAFFLQGVYPEPIGDEIGPGHRAYIAALNGAIGWLNASLGLELPTVTLDGVHVLKDHLDDPKRASPDLPDLHRVGGFYDEERIYLLQSFLDLARLEQAAAGLLALILKRAGRDAELWVPHMTAIAFGGQVTMEHLAELAEASAIQGTRPVEKFLDSALHGRDDSAVHPPPPPRVSLWSRAKALLTAVAEKIASLRSRIPAVDPANPYVLAAAMAALLPVMYFVPQSKPYVFWGGVVMVLIALGRVMSALLSSRDIPMDAAAPPEQGPKDEVVLPTEGAKFLEMDYVMRNDKKVGQYALFWTGKGETLLTRIVKGPNPGLTITFWGGPGWQTTMHIVGPSSSLEGLAETPHEYVIRASDFIHDFWPGLRAALVGRMESLPVESRKRARLGTFLERFEQDLEELGGNAPVRV